MASAGGHERFERLYASSYEPLLAYATRRCSSGEDAADVVAETFTTAWRRVDEVPEGAPGLFWLYATARRVIANQHRGGRRRAALHERLVLEADRVFASSAPLRDSSSDVASALLRLKDSDRELLQLTAWEGLTPAEVGSVVGCSPATARVRLHRARQRLGVQMSRAAPRRQTRGDELPSQTEHAGGST